MKKKEKIQININYGTEVAVFPANAVTFIDKAKKFDMKVLFLLCSSEKYRGDKFAENISKELDCEVGDVETSVAFWNGAGVLAIDTKDEKSKKQWHRPLTGADHCQILPRGDDVSFGNVCAAAFRCEILYKDQRLSRHVLQGRHCSYRR